MKQFVKFAKSLPNLCCIVFYLIFIMPLLLYGQERELYFTISVPIDYTNPKVGKTTVSYELAAPFSKNKATIFIIADAQQFYVRQGAAKDLQVTLLDTSFNVVAIINRSNNSDLKSLVTDNDGNIDWQKAHHVYSWYQYINDINEVRKKIVGNAGKINLLGQSGGGFLIHQFLSIYGQYVDKAFTASPVNYHLEAALGINHDRFWGETSASIPDFSDKIKQLIAQGTIERENIVMLFQRQHFFVAPDSLPSEREKLLNILINNDTNLIKQYQEKYQIKAIQQFYTSAAGIPIKVRLFEFIFPLLNKMCNKENILMPDIENLYFSSQPLTTLYQEQKIQPRIMDFKPLHSLKTNVFVLAGKWDHTVDYRTQIALAFCYPNHTLFIADDNHTFTNLKSSGQYQKLILLFFKSDTTQQIQAHIETAFSEYRWIEQ